MQSGATDTASELLAAAELSPLDDLQRARVDLLRARIALASRRGRDAPPLLLTAAEHLAPLDPGLARETYLEALEAAMFAGRLGRGDGVLQAAEVARAAPPAPQPPRPIDLLLDGLATRFTQGYAAAVPPLRQALRTLSRGDGRSEDTLRWVGMACRVASDLWDDEAWHELATRAVRLAREAGVLTVLPLADSILAAVRRYGGDLAAAATLLGEAEVTRRPTHRTDWSAARPPRCCRQRRRPPRPQPRRVRADDEPLAEGTHHDHVLARSERGQPGSHPRRRRTSIDHPAAMGRTG